MKKLSTVFVLATSLAACVVGNDADPDHDLPSKGVTEDDTVTPQDQAFYDISPVVAGDPGMIDPVDTLPTLDTGARGGRAEIWYRDHRGSTAYEGLCELAAELSFGTRGQYPSAIANWHSRISAGRAHPGDRHPPGGALVFWNTSVFGHVAVADGNGGMWSTSVNNRIGHATSLNYFVNYLGWAWAPGDWPGR
jgi:hypothetical protein